MNDGGTITGQFYPIESVSVSGGPRIYVSDGVRRLSAEHESCSQPVASIWEHPQFVVPGRGDRGSETSIPRADSVEVLLGVHPEA